MKGKNMKIKHLCIILILLMILIIAFPVCNYALSKYGSRGEEVKKIQEKLKAWGYYSGSVDGIYGSQTFEAVKKFQRKNNLSVDGIAGQKTLAALGITSGGNSSNKNQTTSNNTDLNLLSKLVHAEARGEPYKGMVAVAATVLNRVANSKFPNTIAGVIYQSGAFTAVADGQINAPISEGSTVYKAAQDAKNGWDPTGGCIYYFNPSTATNKWIWSRPLVKTIGKHRFCI